jgi:TatD DNase family protein
VYVAAGVHPHDAKHYGEAVEARLEKLLREEPKALAWGEIGLDFHYSHSPAEVQKAVFERQLRAAKKLRLPVIIHSREADTETLEILREVYGKTERGGIMHCFGGGPELARGVLELNFMISFAGNVTFKKAENLREVARMVPLERLLIETDCPYLTPAPYRGLRNEPARVLEVARCLAESRHIGAEELGAVTGANFERFFGLAG